MSEDVMDFFLRVCREHESYFEVGPAHYQRMADLDDGEMEDLLTAVVHAHAKYISRLLFEKSETSTEGAFIDLMKSTLSLLFHGYITLTPEGYLGCCAPEGPDPTEEEEEALNLRIDSALPMVPSALLRAIKEGLLDHPVLEAIHKRLKT